MKLIKRMAQTSYYLDDGKLYLVNNFGGGKRLATVVDRGGRDFNRDVGFIDELDRVVVKEPFSEIPEIQFVRKAIPEVVVEENPIVKVVVEPKAEKVIVVASIDGTRKRKLSVEDRVKIVDEYVGGSSSRDIAKKWGVSYSIVMRYVRKAGVEYRAVSGRKKAPTS